MLYEYINIFTYYIIYIFILLKISNNLLTKIFIIMKCYWTFIKRVIIIIINLLIFITYIILFNINCTSKVKATHALTVLSTRFLLLSHALIRIKLIHLSFYKNSVIIMVSITKVWFNITYLIILHNNDIQYNVIIGKHIYDKLSCSRILCCFSPLSFNLLHKWINIWLQCSQ